MASRGGALLAVLWLSAALAAIAFSVASTVRTETSRAGTTSEALRAQYLASGSIDRAILWIYWGMQGNHVNPDGSPRYYKPPMPLLRYQYPGGNAIVEIIPEAGKFNLNTASPQDLHRVILAVGAHPRQADEITAAIVDWRSPAAAGGGSPFDSFYRAAFSRPGQPAFSRRRASFQETEELLLVKGMTPELFYGQYLRDTEGRLVPRGGLRDAFTVYGQGSGIDVNTASPELLMAIGIPQPAVQQIAAMRMILPFKNAEDLQQRAGVGGDIASRLTFGGATIWTLRATARTRVGDGRLGEISRTVSAIVKFLPEGVLDPPYHILRWREEAWSPISLKAF